MKDIPTTWSDESNSDLDLSVGVEEFEPLSAKNEHTFFRSGYYVFLFHVSPPVHVHLFPEGETIIIILRCTIMTPIFSRSYKS